MTNKSCLVVSMVWLVPAVACSGSGGGSACDFLLTGDLVITEVMANPEGEDKGFEWFEIFNATSGEIDLEGVQLSSSRADGTDRKFHTFSELTIAAGQYLVVGNATGADLPAHVDYGYGTSLGDLRNSGGRLAVECDLTPVDVAVYDQADSGTSIGFDGDRAPDALANDDLNAWCAATVSFDTMTLGSPGTANEPCEGGVTPGTCKDGFTDRVPVPPTLGDLVISEIMPNPDFVKDAQGEWFEVYVVNMVDLNGLAIGMDLSKDPKLTLTNENCLKYGPGSYVLFARDADPLANGGLPTVDFTHSISLGNQTKDPGTGLYLMMNSIVLDAVDYEYVGKDHTGASISLDNGKLDPGSNDDPMNWCPGVDAYGAGDLGTPKAANPACL